MSRDLRYRQGLDHSDDGAGRAFLGAAGLLLVATVFLASLAVKLPGQGEAAALVFAPGTAPARAMAAVVALDGEVLRAGRGNIIVARFQRALSFAELRRAGAWFALDPLVAAGCAAPLANQTSTGFVS